MLFCQMKIQYVVVSCLFVYTIAIPISLCIQKLKFTFNIQSTNDEVKLKYLTDLHKIYTKKIGLTIEKSHMLFSYAGTFKICLKCSVITVKSFIGCEKVFSQCAGGKGTLLGCGAVFGPA